MQAIYIVNNVSIKKKRSMEMDYGVITITFPLKKILAYCLVHH